MINKLEIAGVHMTPDEKLEHYARRKIGKLDHFIPRKCRESVHAEIKLKNLKAKNKKSYMCEVILNLPHDKFAVSESTINMYAAIDIVEAKLKNQLRKYKELHQAQRFHKKLSLID